ncbi:MAG TPA: inositol monophosphatase family protein [Candidatus Acidoferrales bacterium]|nr:inositol monophosphatase family protein [Candidatus Acidoferrales bacterium]
MKGGTLLAAVSELAALAGDHALRHFRGALDVETKSDGSPVTRADRETEALAREWISRHFPGDAILGEELGGVAPAAARTWVIDPIDGTRSFVKGVPLWATLVAVTEHGEVVAGAAEFPACGERIAAARGEGAWWNGAPTRVSDVAALADATLLHTGTAFGDERRPRWDALLARAGTVRTWGDAYGYLLVASGRAEVMMDPSVQLWDAAPVQVIVEEAGGRFTDWNGERTPSGRGAIATNAALDEAVRAALCTRKPGRPA